VADNNTLIFVVSTSSDCVIGSVRAFLSVELPTSRVAPAPDGDSRGLAANVFVLGRLRGLHDNQDPAPWRIFFGRMNGFGPTDTVVSLR